jgi:hypothetical protein
MSIQQKRTEKTPLLAAGGGGGARLAPAPAPTNPTAAASSSSSSAPAAGAAAAGGLGGASVIEEEEEFIPPDSDNFLGKHAIKIVLGYILFGSLAFWLLERYLAGNAAWHWWDGLYFAIVTLTTVGYGDLVMTTGAGKIFVVFYILCGLSLVATSLGIMAGKMEEEAFEDAAEDEEVDEDGDGIPDPPKAPENPMRKHYLEVANALGILVGFGLVGTLFVHFNEGFGWLDAFYWSFVTLSSVGYGDLTTTQESTRIFCIFYVFFGVGATASSLGRFAKVWMEIEEERHVSEFVGRGVSVGMIGEIDKDGEGSVDKWEFMSYMLVKMGKLRRHDLAQVRPLARPPARPPAI